MYITTIICVCISIVTLCVFVVVDKNRNLKFRLSVCVVAILTEILTLAYLPIRPSYFDSVQLTASGNANDEALSSEVFLKSVFVRDEMIDFPAIESGKWFWLDGMYAWRPQSDERQPEGITESVVLKIPVGINRRLVFSGNPWQGYVYISMGEFDVQVDLYRSDTQEITVELPNSESGLLYKSESTRIAMFLALNILFFLISNAFCKVLLPKLIYIIKKYRYEVAFLTYCFFIILKYSLFPEVDPYVSTFYVSSYEFGFVKRGLIGELLTNLVPYITKSGLAVFKLLFALLFYLFVSILIGRVVRCEKDEKIRWFFILMICALPSTFMFVADDMRFDVYILLLFMICVVLIAQDKVIWSIPIVVTCILLINETSCAYLIPPILAMLLYKYGRSEKKVYIGALIGSVIATLMSTVLFLFGENPRTAYDSAQIFRHIQYHADFALDEFGLTAETWGIDKQINNWANNLTAHRGQTAIFFMSLLPILFLLLVIWSTVYRRYNVKNEKNSRVIFLILSLSGLPTVSVMAISLDYPRYCSFFINVAFITVSFFIYEEKVQFSYGDLRLTSTDDGTFNVVPLAICIFYITYGMFASTAYGITTVNRIHGFICQCLKIF